MERLKSEEGQTLVEFALVLPILLILVIGIFDFGSAFNSKNSLNFLANSAARFAEVNSCAPCAPGQSIEDYVKSTGDTPSLRGPDTHITFCLANPGKKGVGDPLQVSATTTFNWLVGTNLPGLPNGSAALKSTVTVRILTAPDNTLYTPANSC